jgi:hypothetical protein
LFYLKLAKEYKCEAENLKKHIDKLKYELASELSRHEFSACRRMMILNDIYLDLKYTGKFLESYEQEVHG